MSDLNNFTSLMDFASFDTSDLKAQTSRLQAAGLYIVELNGFEFADQPPQDPADPMNYTLSFKENVLAFIPEDKDYAGNPEEMVGREITERYFFYGKDIQTAIQLLMGRYKKSGFRYKGKMGGVPGQEPGWLDEAIGQRIAVRVRHRTNKNGDENAIFDWLDAKQLEKAGIDPVEILGRTMEEVA